MSLVSLISNFRGFFIQARTGDNTIVGTWTPMNDDEAHTVMCNGAADVSSLCIHCYSFIVAIPCQSAVTHRSRDEKDGQVFMWTAPSSDVGQVYFM